MTSSVVSFGFYFTADVMSGSRYLNLALMGALKFTLGLLPFAFSFMVSLIFEVLEVVKSSSMLITFQLLRKVRFRSYNK